ncbi:hypothetical protein [Lunatimonas salinarum]|uniref:hypothetical protein n=1 Tax=Lunatimonas salinarum TaxID=1774590 RepID=UPI001ADF10D4|nr:hypothetical protein [Lunatimonas salinarum]
METKSNFGLRGNDNVVYFYFLRNKTERLTNTALPALGKASVARYRMQLSGMEQRATLAVWCRKWVNEESEVRTNGINLLEAHGCGQGVLGVHQFNFFS